VLNIKNQDKLLGKAIYSKFLPQMGEWQVVSVLRDEHSFNIRIQNTKTRDMDRIYLDRQPHFDPASFEPKYRLMGYCKLKGEEKSKLIGKPQIQDMDMLLIQMITVLNKMRPTT
jgi:hypothetical protein